MELVVGWENGADKEGNPIEFSKGELKKACLLDYFLVPACDSVIAELRLEHVKRKTN